jgi:hypothetical protein
MRHRLDRAASIHTISQLAVSNSQVTIAANQRLRSIAELIGYAVLHLSLLLADFPPVTLSRGVNSSQDANCPSVGDALRSAPTSE